MIFFFKQKTAYEMRISDWSSDVCSSDLDKRSRYGGTTSLPRRMPPPGEPSRAEAAGPGGAWLQRGGKSQAGRHCRMSGAGPGAFRAGGAVAKAFLKAVCRTVCGRDDRKSTRLNSSH